MFISQKGDLIKTIGQDCDRLLFIEKGVVRGYLLKYHDTYWFKKENDFIFLLQQSGNQKNDKKLWLEMLEDGILWEFTGGFYDSHREKNSPHSIFI